MKISTDPGPKWKLLNRNVPFFDYINAIFCKAKTKMPKQSNYLDCVFDVIGKVACLWLKQEETWDDLTSCKAQGGQV